MTEKEKISGWVDEELKEDAKRIADQQDQSVSKFVESAVRKEIERQKLEALSDQYSIEQRILSMVDSAADQAADQITQNVIEELRQAASSGESSDSESDMWDDWDS